MNSGIRYRWGGLTRWSLQPGFILLHYLMAVMGLSCLIFSEILTGMTGLFLILVLGICLYLELKKIIPLKPPARSRVHHSAGPDSTLISCSFTGRDMS